MADLVAAMGDPLLVMVGAVFTAQLHDCVHSTPPLQGFRASACAENGSGPGLDLEHLCSGREGLGSIAQERTSGGEGRESRVVSDDEKEEEEGGEEVCGDMLTEDASEREGGEGVGGDRGGASVESDDISPTGVRAQRGAGGGGGRGGGESSRDEERRQGCVSTVA